MWKPFRALIIFEHAWRSFTSWNGKFQFLTPWAEHFWMVDESWQAHSWLCFLSLLFLHAHSKISLLSRSNFSYSWSECFSSVIECQLDYLGDLAWDLLRHTLIHSTIMLSILLSIVLQKEGHNLVLERRYCSWTVSVLRNDGFVDRASIA